MTRDETIQPGRAVRGVMVAAAPVVAAAAIGALASRDAAAVYQRLERPSWAPPGAVFGPAWTVLYGTIGYTGWRMWRHGAGLSAWTLHGLQLALNAAWSPVFFTRRDKRASLVIIAALDAAITAQISVLVRRDRLTATGLVPYLCWSGFATALNAAVSDPGAAS